MESFEERGAIEEGGAKPSFSIFHRARLGFRSWRRSRPFWAGLWTMLGGLMMLAGPLSAFKVLLVANEVVVGVVVGVLVSLFGLFLWFTPGERHLFGVLIVVASVVSFFTSDLGGFVVGMLLGMVGGAMGFAWTPTEGNAVAVSGSDEQPAAEA
jgi:uncharacterized protein DUF6114